MNSYLKKGGTAIVDQVLFSGSNFLLNIFLVKLLTPGDYGLFGSLYSLYLLICILFIAIFLEPYIYYKNSLADTERYTKLYAGFANSLLLFSLLMTIVGYLSDKYAFIYISYAFTTCVIYFYKRHFLSILSLKYSLYISISYFILIIAGLATLTYLIPQNLFNAFFVLNVASALSVIFVIFSNKQFKTILYKHIDLSAFVIVLKNQRKYSFHCFTSGLLSWIPNNIYFIILPIFYSREINALFKALQNISLPITHLNIAIVSLLVPVFMKSLNPEKLIKNVSLLFIIIPLVYLIGILFSLNAIEHYIYNDKYEVNPLFVIAILLGIIPEIIANIYKAFFRSIEKPQVVTKINLINVGMATVCVYFVYRFALTGVIISYLTINAFNLLSSLYFFVLVAKGHKRNLYEVA